MFLSFNDFFVRLDNVFFSDCHILISPNENLSLICCVFLQLNRHRVDIVHDIFSSIELLLSFVDNLGVEINFSFDLKCTWVDLHLLLSFKIVSLGAFIYWIVRPKFFKSILKLTWQCFFSLLLCTSFVSVESHY